MGFGTIILVIIISTLFVQAGELAVNLPDKTIKLESDRWEKMKDPTNFAKNFREKKKSPAHEYGRIVTVYLNPMTEDRKLGLHISEDEYIEIFIVDPGLVTVQTRLDKGKYWVLCRETFKPKGNIPMDISKYRPYLSENENRKLWNIYQKEIDETRYLLRSKF